MEHYVELGWLRKTQAAFAERCPDSPDTTQISFPEILDTCGFEAALFSLRGDRSPDKSATALQMVADFRQHVAHLTGSCGSVEYDADELDANWDIAWDFIKGTVKACAIKAADAARESIGWCQAFDEERAWQIERFLHLYSEVKEHNQYTDEGSCYDDVLDDPSFPH